MIGPVVSYPVVPRYLSLLTKLCITTIHVAAMCRCSAAAPVRRSARVTEKVVLCYQNEEIRGDMLHAQTHFQVLPTFPGKGICRMGNVGVVTLK